MAAYTRRPGVPMGRALEGAGADENLYVRELSAAALARGRDQGTNT